jgi:hypothetical protein
MAGLDKFLADERVREIATQLREIRITADPLSLVILFRDWHVETVQYGDDSNPYKWKDLLTLIMDCRALPGPDES